MRILDALWSTYNFLVTRVFRKGRTESPNTTVPVAPAYETSQRITPVPLPLTRLQTTSVRLILKFRLVIKCLHPQIHATSSVASENPLSATPSVPSRHSEAFQSRSGALYDNTLYAQRGYTNPSFPRIVNYPPPSVYDTRFVPSLSPSANLSNVTYTPYAGNPYVPLSPPRPSPASYPEYQIQPFPNPIHMFYPGVWGGAAGARWPTVGYPASNPSTNDPPPRSVSWVAPIAPEEQLLPDESFYPSLPEVTPDLFRPAALTPHSSLPSIPSRPWEKSHRSSIMQFSPDGQYLLWIGSVTRHSPHLLQAI